MNFLEAPFFDELISDHARPDSVWVTTSDNLRLRLTLWRSGEHGTVLILAGRTEYIEKYCHVAAFLNSHGFAVAVLDWRGQGLSDRLHSDRRLGHVKDFAEYQIDLKAALNTLAVLGPPGPLFLLAHSMGGCIGLRALHCGLDVRASVFTAPMWGLRGLRLLGRVVPLIAGFATLLNMSTGYIPGADQRNYAQIATPERNLLTSDPDMFRRATKQLERRPELSIGGPSWCWLNAANSEMRELSKMSAPNHPALVLVAENEHIADNGRIRDTCSKWPTARLELVSGAWHDVLQETPKIRKHCFEIILDFLALHA